MKKFAVMLVAALVAASAFAEAGWVGAGAININGTWYRADENDGNVWAGEFFGGNNLGNLYKLDLGGQVQLWDKESADWGAGTPAYMYYKFDDANEFTQTSLDYYKYEPNNNYYQTGGEPMVAQSIASFADLGEGAHTLTIYFEDYDGKVPTAQYTANFTKTIPEPATMSLLGLGALAMVIRRKLSK